MDTRCRDCGTFMQQIDFRPGFEAWLCPVAVEAKSRGLLGKPGRKHKEAWVYEMSYMIKKNGNAGQFAEAGDVIISRDKRAVYYVSTDGSRRRMREPRAIENAIKYLNNKLEAQERLNAAIADKQAA